MIESAIVKRHSTLGQALQTGKDAQARYVILTHFSQRSPKLPLFGAENANIAFAADYMSCSYDHMDELCRICPHIFERIAQLEDADDVGDD
jgi:ribonuclease Z